MGRTVAVINQKGGVGKTTVTLGLASAAWADEARVLVVDLDPQGASSWVLGIDPAEVELSTAEVLGRSSAPSAIQASAWGDTVHVLPASPRLQPKEHGSGKEPASRLRAALAEVIDDYDVVLLDCPPSVGNLTTNGLTAADHALVVVEPAALGLRGIAAVTDLIDDVWGEHNPGLDLAGVVVNKVPAISSEAERRFDELGTIVGKRAVWKPAIPQRVIVNEALGDRYPIHAYGARAADVSVAFDQLWAKLKRVMKG
ncbi:MAG: ParA family protein [Ilumatobacteraceae bacterium]